MKKTLLLCFIHGFKGGEDTFGHNYQFTEDLRRLVAEKLPKINVRVEVYPRYETRGDLNDCVSRFRDWLLEKVIDLEVAAGTPSPTVDPSVRAILIGHSMGGIVAAETAIELTSDTPIPPDGSGSNTAAPEHDKTASASLNSLMFPFVQGVLAFDTPFLGISPGVVAHNAEGHYARASEVVTQLSGLTALWGGTTAAASDVQARSKDGKSSAAALPAPAGAAAKKDDAVAAAAAAAAAGGGGWGRWGRIAMYAGAAGALAAGGAAAYLNREQLTEGWSWAYSHLEFVGTLARGEDLRRRVAFMVRLNRELGVGFANLYTRLGDGAAAAQVGGSSSGGGAGVVSTVLGRDRTFCILPRREVAGEWQAAVNNAAADETWAHMSMFEPKENPGYAKLSTDAAQLITTWAKNDWYEGSTAQQLEG